MTGVVGPQQLEPIPSSAAAGEISETNVTNFPSVTNVAMLTNLLSQMLQYCNTNAVVSPGISPANVTAPCTAAGNLNIAASGNVNPHGTHAVNVDNYTTSATNEVNANSPVFNMAVAWVGNSGLTTTSSVASFPDNSVIGEGSGVSEACFKEYVNYCCLVSICLLL